MTPANRLSNPYPAGLLEPLGSSAGLSTALGTNINYQIRDREIPAYHQYSIGVQHQLRWRSVIDVSFVGSATRKRPVTRPVNTCPASRSCSATRFSIRWSRTRSSD